MLEGIHWLGHASFRIENKQVIYIDPWKLKHPAKLADLILITHGHHDHLSPDDIAKISKPDTVVVCPFACADKVRGRVRTIVPGQSMQIGDVRIEAVPSYNVNKPNHPKEAGTVGYVIEVGGQRIYHAGDTDLIPEMANIHCDVALLPAGGKYTMDATEAAQSLGVIKPKVAVPMHWGSLVGSEADARHFQKQAPQGVQVVIMRVE